MLKVAHVFKSLAAGGIEKWLTDVAIDNYENNVFELHFLLQSKDVGFFESELPSECVSIKKWEVKNNFFKYCFELYNNLKSEKYDVVHSHVHHFSGLVLFIAFIAGVKVRVAHSHNDKRAEHKLTGFTKKIYFLICKFLIISFSNRKIAVSDNASKSLFPFSKNVKILPCGLKLLAPIVQSTNDEKIDNRKIIIGHIGSFSKQKNHVFICDLALYLERKYPGLYEFQLVGGGDLFDSISSIINKKGLGNIVKLLGLRKDVRELIVNEFDIVILPSLHEGLAMVALESQYYGKPLIVSDTLSTQHTLSDYIQYQSICSLVGFSNAIYNYKRPTVEQIYVCRKKIDASPLSVSFNIQRLKYIYSFREL
jgi:glycosyltransferase EpsF